MSKDYGESSLAESDLWDQVRTASAMFDVQVANKSHRTLDSLWDVPTVTHEQLSIILILKTIADLSDEHKVAVADAADQIREVILKHGKFGVLACTLVASEFVSECAKSLENPQGE